ncbi:hypothetical protein [Nocardioides sp. SYSU D00065]|uniref:hypothetical protein n=1 Tax=Nocardioides sp. SYSU D00065 TaxID=2817378 RepID=UPI001B315010|nr:hypothetical protein [Nocardioides sp. SYSU D00065]
MDDERREVPTTVLAAVAGLLAGVGLGAVAILAWVDGNEADDPAPAANQSALVEVERDDSEPEPAATGARASRMDRCTHAAQALRTPLEAAVPALRQWEVHIEAMNQLVVGEITLQQATDFWDRTRVGAQRRVDAFNAAWAGVRREAVECPAPVVAPVDPVLRPCVEQVGAQISTLEAARTSIRMWAHHVEHMDMLRLGQLSPEDATAMWLSMWRRGDRELDVYQAAARESRAERGCSEAASTG